MFNTLDENELNTVILAFVERRFKEGESVITQGEQGDVLYLIEKGELDCYKTFDKEEGPKHLKVYYPGEAFGELALLYNAPRAATIIAKEDCILWALDRETFNHIVKDAAVYNILNLVKRETNMKTSLNQFLFLPQLILMKLVKSVTLYRLKELMKENIL
jgi:cAMP-dependent protein kinase regulator